MVRTPRGTVRQADTTRAPVDELCPQSLRCDVRFRAVLRWVEEVGCLSIAGSRETVVAI